MIDDFFNLIETLNEITPVHFSFLTKVESGYYGKLAFILIHGQTLGTITARGWGGAKDTFSISLNLGESYISDQTEVRKNWTYTTKGVALKITHLIEEMVERSRLKLGILYNNQSWDKRTVRDLNKLIHNKRESSQETHKTYKFSGVRLSAIVPEPSARKQFPRVYKFLLNKQPLFDGRTVPIDDPTLKLIVKNVIRFERQLKGVLENA